MNTNELYAKMKECSACALRSKCKQVVTATGELENPLLMIIGEAPGADEDKAGEPFVGRAGFVLRRALKETGVLNKKNTIITNLLKCRPPDNKFPTQKEIPILCSSLWLYKEIETIKPQRLLLLGGQALKYVAGMTGIRGMRGEWIMCKGIRTLSTYHPSYVIRNDNEGDMSVRTDFEKDIDEMAAEIASL